MGLRVEIVEEVIEFGIFVASELSTLYWFGAMRTIEPRITLIIGSRPRKETPQIFANKSPDASYARNDALLAIRVQPPAHHKKTSNVIFVNKFLIKPYYLQRKCFNNKEILFAIN